MIIISLSKEQRANLLAFLNRVDLKGNEAMVMAVLQQVIATAKEEIVVAKEEEKPRG